MSVPNLFTGLPTIPPPAEVIESLWGTDRVTVERIVSWGHATAAGEWFDQETDEWVVLLSGSAGVTVEGQRGVTELGPGNWLLIPAGVRHRVEWTDPAGPTVWLAVHAAASPPRPTGGSD